VWARLAVAVASGLMVGCATDQPQVAVDACDAVRADFERQQERVVEAFRAWLAFPEDYRQGFDGFSETGRATEAARQDVRTQSRIALRVVTGNAACFSATERASAEEQLAAYDGT
jgi:hypothetical protein